MRVLFTALVPLFFSHHTFAQTNSIDIIKLQGIADAVDTLAESCLIDYKVYREDKNGDCERFLNLGDELFERSNQLTKYYTTDRIANNVAPEEGIRALKALQSVDPTLDKALQTITTLKSLGYKR